MIALLEDIAPLFISPVSGAPLRPCGNEFVDATNSESRFPTIASVPVLVDFSRSLFARDELVGGEAASRIGRPSVSGPRQRIKRLLLPPKTVTSRNIDRFIELLLAQSSRPSVLVIGGGTIGQGVEALYDHPDIQVIALDVYASPLAQLIADAHQVPLADGCVDGVVAQAVLEHVLEPHVVVDEIWRVLKPGGIVYAETPFMQQVHEGAYDFLRFTASGHRWLFRRFDAIATGVCGGAGTQMLWSIDYLVRGLFRSVRAGKAAKLMFFWVGLLDGMVPASYSHDSASGFYLMGRKSGKTLQPRDVVASFVGYVG